MMLFKDLVEDFNDCLLTGSESAENLTIVKEIFHNLLSAENLLLLLNTRDKLAIEKKAMDLVEDRNALARFLIMNWICGSDNDEWVIVNSSE